MIMNQFLILSAFLFCTGIYGVLARKNAVLVLMSIELMLNAVNINLVAYSAFHHVVAGQVFALFVIAVAAAAGILVVNGIFNVTLGATTPIAPAVFTGVTTAATEGVPADHAGIASGLLNASMQFGGASGLAAFLREHGIGLSSGAYLASTTVQARVAQGLGRCLGAGVHAELAVHLFEVRPNGLDVEEQRVGDLLVAQPLGEQCQHLALACRQPQVVERPAVRPVGSHGACPRPMAAACRPAARPS